MRFVTDLSKGILGKPDSTELWQEVISNIPDEMFLKKNLKILNVACGHGTEADVIVNRMRSLGRTMSDIKDSMYLLDKYSVFTKDALRKGYKNVIQADFLEWETDMKFDAVIGNPPYQDGSKEGGQNKIYNQFSKKAIELSDIVAFVTPASVCKKSKRFSLIGQPGLKLIDFTADKHFDVGIKICSWVVDKSYTGDVSVIYNGGSDTQSNTQVAYDYSKVDKTFADLYTCIKQVTDTPNKRMFKQNAVDSKSGRNDEKTVEFKYAVYKISNGKEVLVQYNKPMPKFINELKFVISMTKGFNDDAILISKSDFDVAHMYTNVSSDTEVDNIKSFIFSDYFKAHSQRWKDLDGYGYNYALKHLPPFDKTKSWTNEEVKDFIESHVK
tara:strand:+ start:874 stop:2025 length:1152 start_codon:yes stop_codon:yes gene_type:complete